MTLDEYIALCGTPEELVDLVHDFIPQFSKDFLAKLLPCVGFQGPEYSCDFNIAVDDKEMWLTRGHPTAPDAFGIYNNQTRFEEGEIYCCFDTDKLTTLPAWLPAPDWFLIKGLADPHTYTLIYDPPTPVGPHET